MKPRTSFSYYSLTSGEVAGFHFTGSLEHAQLNCPPEHGVLIGLYSPALHRYDVSQGRMIAVEPAGPDLNLLKTRLEAVVMGRIAEAEARQLRPMREVLIAANAGEAAPEAAMAVLQSTEIEIQDLRGLLAEVRGAAGVDELPAL